MMPPLPSPHFGTAGSEPVTSDTWTRDGYLFIVGRIKDIINRGGQKVAPAEVEQALLSHPDVVEAAAFSIPHRRLGEDVAAAVVLRQDAKVSAQRLRDFARERLARFKVPGLIRIVPEIPKGAGRKDQAQRTRGRAFNRRCQRRRWNGGGKLVSPRSELEWQLAKIWADLLDFNQIGIDEDVFALGADSITVTQMLSRLRGAFWRRFLVQGYLRCADRCGSRGSPRVIGKGSSDVITELARSADGNRARERRWPTAGVHRAGARATDRAGTPWTTPVQPAFRLSAAGTAERPCARAEPCRGRAPALTRCARDLPGWTNCLLLSLPRPTTSNHPSSSKILQPGRLSEIPEPRHSCSERRSWKPSKSLDALRHEPCALVPGAPLAARRRSTTFLLLILHDIIIDGWSMEIFMEELSELYAAFAAGRQAQLPEPALQFSDFARWQRRWSTSGAADPTVRLLEGAPAKGLTCVSQRMVTLQAQLAARVAQEPVHVSNDLVARLSALSQSRGATLFMTLLTGFKTLLLLRSGRNDICVATTMANRSQLGTERVIGPFANTTLIRTRIDADLTFQEALNRVRDAVLEAYARQELPSISLPPDWRKKTVWIQHRSFKFIFVLQDAFRRPIKLHDVAVRPFGYREGKSGSCRLIALGSE